MSDYEIISRLIDALREIEQWQLPSTGRFTCWGTGDESREHIGKHKKGCVRKDCQELSFGWVNGRQGEREYFRAIARDAIEVARVK